ARGTGAPRVFWCCAIAYFVALALGDLTPVANLTYQVPIVNVGHEWARLFVVVAFAVALLAGLGTAALADRVESRRVWGPLCLVVCVVAVVLLLLQVSPFTVVPIAAGARLPPGWSFSPFENPAVAVPLMLVVATTVVVALTRRGSAGGRLTAVVVPALVLVDLATFGYAHDWRYSSRPADDVVRRPASLESLRTGLLQTGQRIASYRGDTEDGRLVAKRESRDDRTGLRQEIGRFWGFDTLEYFGKWTTPEFNRLTDQLGGDDLSRGQRALDMLAVRYLLVYAPRENDVPDPSVRRLAEMMLAHPESWRDLGQRGHSRAFENLSALPRAWLVRQSHALDTDAAREAIRSGRLPDGTSFDPRTAVLVDRNPGGGGADVPARGDAQILSRTSGHTRVRVSSSQPSVLVLSDTFHRSWRATIDGAPVDIQRANLVLQTVAVPAGQHLVELRFVPMDFYAGAAISLAALLLGVAGLIASASSRGPTGPRLG
ncbi:MAG: YfhO family protein, partial [Vicinamibacterales bacterium]